VTIPWTTESLNASSDRIHDVFLGHDPDVSIDDPAQCHPYQESATNTV